MRSRYLPTSLTSTLTLTLTEGCSAQFCQAPFALIVLSGPVSTRFSMVQSSALLTATSSILPRSVLLTISLSATMSSAGRSRKGAPSPLPGVASGMLKCFSRATMRPKPSGRQVISPSSSFAATFAIHRAPLAEIERSDLEIEGRRERGAGPVLALEQRSPAVGIDVGKAARHENAFPVGEHRGSVQADHASLDDVARAFATAPDLRVDGGAERDFDRVRARQPCADHALDPERHRVDGRLSERRWQVRCNAGELRPDEQGRGLPLCSGKRALPGGGARDPARERLSPVARNLRRACRSTGVDDDHAVGAGGHRNRRRTAEELRGERAGADSGLGKLEPPDHLGKRRGVGIQANLVADDLVIALQLEPLRVAERDVELQREAPGAGRAHAIGDAVEGPRHRALRDKAQEIVGLVLGPDLDLQVRVLAKQIRNARAHAACLNVEDGRLPGGDSHAPALEDEIARDSLRLRPRPGVTQIDVCHFRDDLENPPLERELPELALQAQPDIARLPCLNRGLEVLDHPPG